MTSPYAMTLTLNVLNHLGINLYSNVPAVISEVVANAYDADAETVNIQIDSGAGTITISDDGCGMTASEVNERYLCVGYQRRDKQQALTPRFQRPVMGRKGIGKLSLFSIARVIEVFTTKNGERCAFRMRVADIQAQIDDLDSGKYYPEPIPAEYPDDLTQGTRIILRDLKKDLRNVAAGLRKRTARRFSIIGSEYNFQVFIGGREVTATDRDYFHKAQFLWIYDQDPEASFVTDRCTNAEEQTIRNPVNLPEGQIRGWIATAFNPKDLKDEGEQISRVTLMVRGKLAHENLLEEVKESSIFESYLFGEIHADFLDHDDAQDIATSSRQRIVEDDPRYLALVEWFSAQVRSIGSRWTELRNKKGTATALLNPHVKAWFGTLEGDTKKRAERLFGKINQLTLDSPKERAELLAHSILAFEVLRYRDNLDAIEELDVEDLPALKVLFSNIEDLEAVMYHRIADQRLKVIEKLQQHIDDNVLEKVLQAHLFDNLWLLDPSWERATDRTMEEGIGRAFANITENLPKEVRDSRMDLRYKKISGAHVIVELKRYSVVTKSIDLYTQVDKYRNALLLHLRQAGRGDERVECVCVIGKDPSDWSDEDGRGKSEKLLKTIDTRIVKYEELLANARYSYKEYLEQDEKTTYLRKLLTSLADDGGF
ncbi:ATP-binding protein [Nocardia sp. BSTN01]|uniref:BbrUII/HgiDII family restriction enzyme n=1 Tax=Nocardia sp. BSTN01 TaxID=2783665 RepID=UPI00188F80BC|nr:ATP-binding protein [Nocardia sp. BSTN01]MBF4997421.1 ATP-binding protein [Nocardia sp. BSTN01]